MIKICTIIKFQASLVCMCIIYVIVCSKPQVSQVSSVTSHKFQSQVYVRTTSRESRHRQVPKTPSLIASISQATMQVWDVKLSYFSIRHVAVASRLGRRSCDNQMASADHSQVERMAYAEIVLMARDMICFQHPCWTGFEKMMSHS